MLGIGTQFEALDVNEPNIESYIKKFEHHCGAYEITNEQKQILFYTVIGLKAYDILKNACLPEPVSRL